VRHVLLIPALAPFGLTLRHELIVSPPSGMVRSPECSWITGYPEVDLRQALSVLAV
jgi:hypothetical protein